MSFWRRSNDENIRTALTLLKEVDADPASFMARLVSSSVEPASTLALLISILVQEGSISVEDLGILGIDEPALKTLLESVKRSVTPTQIKEELSVFAEIRRYDRQVDQILVSQGLALSSVQRLEFRTELAQFAADNDIVDLTVAFRLLKVEAPTVLTRYQSVS